MRNLQDYLDDLLYHLDLIDLEPEDAILLLSTHLREMEQEQGDLFNG